MSEVYSKECIQCKQIFNKKAYCRPSQFKTQKYCSHACRNIALRNGDYVSNWKPERRYKPRPNSVCLGCGAIIEGRKGTSTDRYDKASTRKFCSLSCKTKELSNNWNGGRYKISKGYIRRHVRSGISQYEHILVAEKVLGRRLKDDECVHHINFDKADNRNCNLMVCTQSYHRWLHEEMGRLYAEEHFPANPSDDYIPDIGEPIGYGPDLPKDTGIL